MGQLVIGVPPEAALPAALRLICDFAVAMFVPWILLAGAVRPRMLLPGALILALAIIAVRPVTAAWLPQALQTSADRYGSIGVAFTYLVVLYALPFAFMATAILGQVIATDPGSLGRWIRSGTAAETRSAGGEGQVPSSRG